MDLEERVAAAIKAGKQKVEGERTANLEFKEGWEKKFEEIGLQMQQAAEVIGKSGGVGFPVVYAQDGCKCLAVREVPNRTPARYELRFCPDRERRLVVCRIYAGGMLRETNGEVTYSIDGLSAEVIQDQLVGFVDTIYSLEAERAK